MGERVFSLVINAAGGFTVNFDETFTLDDKFYTTLYVDFAYTLPEGVKAYKVAEVTQGGTATKEEISGVIPAQTPVLLEAESYGEKEIALSNQNGTAVTSNQLNGNDWLINKYELNASQMESLFLILSSISQSLGEQYDYLKRLNAGTVNNKYFFGLSVPTNEEEGPFRDDFLNGKIKVLGVNEDGELYCPATTETPQWAPGVKPDPEKGNGTGWLPLTVLQWPRATSCAPGREAIYASDESVLTWWQPAANDHEPCISFRLGDATRYELRALRLIWRDIGMETLKCVLPGPTDSQH